MLVSVVADLVAPADCQIPATHGETMQSELFRWLREIDAGLAQQVHGPAGGDMRAYTISPIWFYRAPSKGVYRVRRGDESWFRITCSEPSASEIVSRLTKTCALWKLVAAPHTAEFQVRRWHTSGTEWARTCELVDLERRAGVNNRMTIEFFSPTAFSYGATNGWQESIHLPLPELLFANLEAKLSAAYPQFAATSRGKQWFRTHVGLGKIELKTVMMDFGRRKRRQAGFTGLCEFLFHPDVSEADLHYLCVLAEFGFFSGAGITTSWGMGQMRRTA